MKFFLHTKNIWHNLTFVIWVKAILGTEKNAFRVGEIVSTERNKKGISYEVISKHRGVLMGLAILGIIVFHFTGDCASYDVHFNGLVALYYEYIRSSGVDIFLFLSGFGLYFSFKKDSDRLRFYKRRFTKILIPYVLLCVPAWIWQCFIYENAGMREFLKEVFFFDFFEKGSVWFWYVLIICICYFIFPYVYEIFEQASNRIAEQMYMMSIFSFFTVVSIMLQLYHEQFFSNVEIAFLRFPAFFLGCLIGKAAYEKRKVSMSVWFMMIVSILLLPLSQDTNIIIVRYVLALFALSLFWVITLAFEGFSKIKIAKLPYGVLKNILEAVGRYSFELYLSHVMVRAVFNKQGYYTCYGKNELAMLGISIILSIILKTVTNQIMKLKFFKVKRK